MKRITRYLLIVPLLLVGAQTFAQRGSDLSLESRVIDLTPTELYDVYKIYDQAGDFTNVFLWEAIQSKFAVDANTQHDLMQGASMTLCDFRNNYADPTFGEFFVTQADLDMVHTLCRSVRRDISSTPGLQNTNDLLDVIELYFDKAAAVRYTKHEIFVDFTGSESPMDFFLNYATPDKRANPGMGLYACLNRLIDIEAGLIDQPCFGTKKNGSGALAVAEKLKAFPNPFQDKLTLTFRQTNETPLSVEVYDVRGRKVATLLQGSTTVGERSLTWNGKDEVGNEIATQIFFVKLQQGNRSESVTVVLSK